MHPITKVALAAAAAWTSRRLLRSIPIVKHLSLDDILPTNKVTPSFVIGALVYGYGILSEQKRLAAEAEYDGDYDYDEEEYDDASEEDEDLAEGEDTYQAPVRSKHLVEVHPKGEA